MHTSDNAWVFQNRAKSSTTTKIQGEIIEIALGFHLLFNVSRNDRIPGMIESPDVCHQPGNTASYKLAFCLT